MSPGSGDSFASNASRTPERFGSVRPEGVGPLPPGRNGLEGLYERYCDQEARNLLQIIPRPGLRSLYRAAREDEVPNPGIPDSIGLLVRYTRKLLPLPPYEIWLDAYLTDRRPFLAALGIESAPVRSEPVMVAVRPASDGWMAELHLIRRDDRWCGFVQFRREVGQPGHRTAEIFRGGEPEEIRRSFQEYRPATLDAFLRSVLP